jgi:hypothetical protein
MEMLFSDLRLLISRPFIAGLLNTLRVTNFSGGFIKGSVQQPSSRLRAVPREN